MALVNPQASKAIIAWLMVIMAMVYGTVLVGGLTRLTGSGLSMVKWHPIKGVVPPLNDQEWQDELNHYRQSPEYQKVNKGMSVDEFKKIYYWEYGHRMLGRGIGLVYFLAGAFFFFKGWLRGRLLLRVAIGFVLGGLQGLLGWYMVKSGLVDMPRVSHLRLAAHLSLALFILVYLYWLVLGLIRRPSLPSSTQVKPFLSYLIVFILALQIVYGAFTAGLRAGRIYNSFPDWNGHFVPAGLMQLEPWFSNFIYNPVMVQFVHRGLAYVLILLAVAYVVSCWKSERLRRISLIMLFLMFIQASLGVATLVKVVPLSLASAHQGVAVLLLLCATYNLFLNVRSKEGADSIAFTQA